MTNHLKKGLLLFFLLFYIGLVEQASAMKVFADETNSSDVTPEGTSKFYYKVIKPTNQKSNAGYFDLLMTPNQKQIIQLEFSNYSDVQIGIELGLNSAKTNSNGVIEYGPSELKKDKSLKYDFTEIVKGPKNIILEPKETKTADFEIIMPAEKYDGVISGGIYIQQMESEADKEASKKAKGIQNRYAYLVGVLLSETDTTIQPNLGFNSIRAGLQNYRNSILVNFSNTEMVYLENMTVEAQIMKDGSDEVLYDTKKANLRMAPNTMINFPISMNGDRMEAGDYVGHILVTSEDKKWEWREKFKITNEEADKYNKKDVSLIQDKSINWVLIAGIIIGVLIILFGVFLIVSKVSKGNKKKNNKKKNNAPKKK
ncbi:DUF916 and DUF3324 domain-containing protein [Enterococcus rotai]|uniref:DUF916 and DUF3324 domain-containing protein n=1 Tax=Enterococcus rotai TaxID=118060 RepID=UPI0032B39DDD